MQNVKSANIVLKTNGTKQGTQLMVGEYVINGVKSFQLDPISADGPDMVTATIKVYIGGTDKKE